jgi:hypothetical protein
MFDHGTTAFSNVIVSGAGSRSSPESPPRRRVALLHPAHVSTMQFARLQQVERLS